jgi:hypothetical protein
VAISHRASDIDPERSAEFTRVYNERSAVPFSLRSRTEITRFFDGTELVEVHGGAPARRRPDMATT